MTQFKVLLLLALLVDLYLAKEDLDT